MQNIFLSALCCLIFHSSQLLGMTVSERSIQRSYARLGISSTERMLEKQNTTLLDLLNKATKLDNQTWINKLQEHLEMNTILAQHFRTVDGRTFLDMDAYQTDLEQRGYLISEEDSIE